MATNAREAAILDLIHDSEAIPDTIQIIREKHQGDDAVVAATFLRSSGRLVRGMLGLRRFDTSGWRAAGGGWSSGARDVPADAIWSSSGGWGSATPPRGVTGGWVNEPTARRIRVTDPNGRTEEDTIEAGVAILIWEGDFDVPRATAELLDERGQVIRTGPMRTPR
jgi:hypothetical protein